AQAKLRLPSLGSFGSSALGVHFNAQRHSAQNFQVTNAKCPSQASPSFAWEFWEFRLGRFISTPNATAPQNFQVNEREMPKPSFAFLRLGVLGVPPWAFISTPNATAPKTSKSRTRNAQAKLRLPSLGSFGSSALGVSFQRPTPQRPKTSKSTNAKCPSQASPSFAWEFWEFRLGRSF